MVTPAGKAKGQMAFEFIVAVILLIGVVFYVINYLNTGIFAFSKESKINDMESRALQASNILLYGPGVWAGQEPKQVGVAIVWPVVNNTKLSYLEDYCATNYANLIERLDLVGKKVSIIVDDSSGANVISCGPNLPGSVLHSYVKRFALSENGKILVFNMWVW